MHVILYSACCNWVGTIKSDSYSIGAKAHPHIHICTCCIVFGRNRCCNICNIDCLFTFRFSVVNCVWCFFNYIGANLSRNALSVLKRSQIPRLHARILNQIPQPKPTSIFIHPRLYSLPCRLSSLNPLATQLLFIVLHGKSKLLQTNQQRIPGYSQYS